MGSNAKNPLVQLRQFMSEYEGGALHAFFVPSEDAHQSEYVADCDRRREYVTGFNGSAGLALVTTDSALLWTDGRYFLQASQQLSSEWKLMRVGEDLDAEEWIAQNLPPGSRVGVDGSCVSIDTVRRLNIALEPRDIGLVSTTYNLVDRTWTNRPQAPTGAVAIQDLSFAGQSVSDKLEGLREEMEASRAHGIVVAALDEVAWLFNIRGCDVAYNPVVRSYALVTGNAAYLYVDKAKISTEVEAHLTTNNIQIREYSAISKDAAQAANPGSASPPAPQPQGGKVGGGGARFWVDPATCSYAIYSELLEACGGGSEGILLATSPLALAKALKNEAELAGTRSAHLRDGAACVAFWAWLDQQMQHQCGADGYFEPGNANRNGKTTDRPRKRKAGEGEERLTEVGVATKLQSLRATCQHYVGLSFPTISSVGPHAAIIHYIPTETGCAEMREDQIYLCDSGAQYRDGTTDVTRTVHFGRPSDRERMCYTKVLQGHIALATAVFPAGTTGPHLISYKKHAQDVSLQANMTVTNEPGYYEEGSFGIRIENVMIVKKAEVEFHFDNKMFLEFETITWVPIQVKLMDLSLLTDGEKKWVDGYHSKCRQKLAPLLSGYEKEWLLKATQPLPLEKTS